MIINTILLLLLPMENVQFQILKKKDKKMLYLFFLFVDLYHPLSAHIIFFANPFICYDTCVIFCPFFYSNLAWKNMIEKIDEKKSWINLEFTMNVNPDNCVHFMFSTTCCK